MLGSLLGLKIKNNLKNRKIIVYFPLKIVTLK